MNPFLTSVLLIISLTDAITRLTLDKKDLLTGATYKTWYHYSQTPDDNNASYKVIGADNTFIFYADGTFKFDHGKITEDPACVNECSSDLVNLTGTWTLTNNQTHLIVTTTFETDNPQKKMEMVLIDENITLLTEDRLQFYQKDEETGTMILFEFRKK